NPRLCRSCQQSSYDDEDQQDDRFDLGSVMVLGGALVGGAIGYVLTPHRWRAVGVSVRGAVVPGGDGNAAASLGIRMPFSLARSRR
ncbi:MAG: hypothetical protein HOQ09_14405, partial [Gemmatimonadaceae bacterium]|nr:hypothetical protein [Gemmatimonadaceae bacterium]